MRAQLKEALASGNTGLEVAELNAAVADFVAHVSRVEVPELPDRIIAGTALYLEAPLISRDRKIQLSSVQTLW